MECWWSEGSDDNPGVAKINSQLILQKDSALRGTINKCLQLLLED